MNALQRKLMVLRFQSAELGKLRAGCEDENHRQELDSRQEELRSEILLTRRRLGISKRHNVRR